MTKFEIKKNAEYNSTEIYFECKPTEEERAILKAAGCRWHSVKKCWYTRKDQEEISAILGGTASEGAKERKKSKITVEPELLTLDKLPKAKKIEDGGLYDGWEGANARFWKDRKELKALILKDFKRAGIRATIRADKSGYSEKLVVTVQISENDVKTFEEWRQDYNGDDLNFIYYLFHFDRADYMTEEGKYSSISCEDLAKMPEEPKNELCKLILKSTYDRCIRIQQSANSWWQKSESVLKQSALDRLKLAEAIVSTYNHDCSNSMIDYFDRWIYDDYCVKIA